MHNTFVNHILLYIVAWIAVFGDNLVVGDGRTNENVENISLDNSTICRLKISSINIRNANLKPRYMDTSISYCKNCSCSFVSDNFTFTELPGVDKFKSDLKPDPWTSIFDPISSLAAKHTKGIALESQGFILRMLRDHELLFSTKAIRKALNSVSHHIILGYALMLLGIVAFFAMPVVFCAKACSRNTLNYKRYQCCYFFEVIMVLLIMFILGYGSIGLLHNLMCLDTAWVSYSQMMRDALDDIESYLHDFRDQMTVVHDDLNYIVSYVLETFSCLPEQSINSTRNALNESFNKIKLEVWEESDHLWRTFENSGLMIFNSNQTHSLPMALNSVESSLQLMAKQLSALMTKINEDSNITASEYKKIEASLSHLKLEFNITFNKTNEPNWKYIYETLCASCNGFLFSVEKQISLLDEFYVEAQENIQPLLVNLSNTTLEIQQWSNSTMLSVNNMLENIFKNIPASRLKDLSITFDKDSSILDIKKNNSVVVSGRRVLLLMPACHAFIVLGTMLVGIVAGMNEIKQFYHVSENKRIFSCRTSIGSAFLRYGMIFGLLLVWLSLLVAGVFYILSVFLSMLCEPATDNTLFTNYTDDPTVWGNRTYLDAILQDHIANYTGSISGTKLSELMESCSKNNTFYSALNINQYWEVDKYLNVSSLQIPVNKLKLPMDKAACEFWFNLNQTHIIDQASQMLLSASIKLNTTYLTEVISYVNRIKEQHLLTEISNATYNLPQDAKFEYVHSELNKIAYDVVVLEEKIIQEVHGNMSLIYNLIQQLFDHVVKLILISDHVGNFHNKVKRTVGPITMRETEFRAHTANTLVQRYVSHLNTCLTKEAGNCRIIPLIYKKAYWAVCKNGLHLVNGLWIAFSITGISMLVLLFLSCRLAAYFRGAKKIQRRWHRMIEAHRENSELLQTMHLCHAIDEAQYIDSIFQMKPRKESSLQKVHPVQSLPSYGKSFPHINKNCDKLFPPDKYTH